MTFGDTSILNIHDNNDKIEFAEFCVIS